MILSDPMFLGTFGQDFGHFLSNPGFWKAFGQDSG